MLDEPKPLPETYGYATSGWNAVPTAGKIIGRIAPLLGVTPVFDEDSSGKLEKYKKQRLKELEKENTRLKKLVADLSLDNAILKEVLGKK